ncbi:unnamed protein product [Mytilus edulis]|uniref:Uncharacterized protein n=1 Tax=Mytilus edulis TaxID=6550 RepID=A0A8S3RIQ4_MYTED|nr:unnamed protein product [Mytilus edulis]
MNNGVVIFRFNCSSNIGFKGCTVEGILGNRTHDNIRYANDECFHKDGKCTLECCECSSDCTFFIWNVTILNKTVNNSFGCQSRIESNGITYKAMVFIRHNSNGFTVSNKTVDPIKGYKPIITIRPSISDVPCGSEIDTEPPNVKVSSVADTEQPHSTTASPLKIESNRSTGQNFANKLM